MGGWVDSLIALHSSHVYVFFSSYIGARPILLLLFLLFPLPLCRSRQRGMRAPCPSFLLKEEEEEEEEEKEEEEEGGSSFSSGAGQE